MQQPKVHPMLIGAGYGLVAAILNIVTIQVNHTAIKENGLLGFAGTVLLPLIALFLAGHYAGRHQRLTKIQANATGLAARSVASGTGAGLASGIVYVVLTQLSQSVGFIATHLPYQVNTTGGVWGSTLGTLGFIGGLFGWLFLGLVGGTLGGVFGDSRAHKQIKSGATVAAK